MGNFQVEVKETFIMLLCLITPDHVDPSGCTTTKNNGLMEQLLTLRQMSTCSKNIVKMKFQDKNS